MVGEVQFDRWRADLMKNLKNYGDALNAGDEKREKLAKAALDVGVGVIQGERIGLLAFALNRNDEVLAQVIDEKDRYETVAERVLKAAEKHEADLPDELILELSFLEALNDPDGAIEVQKQSRAK